VEDDAQDGGDHIDSHRTTAYVAGAYVKNGVVSTAYNTIDFIRTMEEVMGLQPMNLNDALATPMSDIFNTTPSAWSFTATPAAILYCTQPAAARPSAAVQQPDSERRTILGARHQGHGLHRCGSRRWRTPSTAFSGRG
jgi:hypothetical protein